VVLIVDDHEDTIAMYALGLQVCGFQPLTAMNAEDAFACACRCRPDVIVTDLMISVQSGFDLVYRLRADPRTRDVAIIALTGLTLASTRQHAREAGCNRFLLKPCVPAALAAEIRDLMLTAKELASRPVEPLQAVESRKWLPPWRVG